MKKILTKNVLTSLLCWLVIMCIDFIFLAAFSLSSSLNFTFFPGAGSSVKIVVCYLSAAILTGLLAYIAGLIKTSLFEPDPSDSFCIPLSLALAVNSSINIYSISRILNGEFPAAIICLFIFPFLLWGFMKITASLQKSQVVALPAWCISLETFWSIIRGSLRGGIFLLNLTETVHIVFTALLSFIVCLALFALFCWWVPFLLSKIRRPLVKTAALVLLLCSLPKDVSVSYAEPEGFNAPADKPCILFIVMDTVRVDHLSCFGYPKKTTPHLDQFAQNALLYKNAFATAPWTLPSIASILTGTYPGHHGAHRVTTSKSYYPANKLNDAQPTLPEILQETGYTTAGMVSCEWLTTSFGLNRGFDHFNDRIPSYFFTLSSFGILQFSNYFFPLKDYLFFNGFYGQRIAHQINKAALPWLHTHGENRPFFLFLHYFDPHHPYVPEHFGTAPGYIPDTIRNRHQVNTANYVDVESEIIYSVLRGETPLLPDERNFLLNNYDRDIGRLDQKLGELFAALKEMNLYDKTLIIITADHGEAFGEHNLMLHGRSLFNNNLHVPLLIKYPVDDKRKGVIDYPVSLAGIVPTVLSYLSIEIPDSIQGSPFSLKNKQLLIAQNFHDPHSKGFPHDLISLQQDHYKYIKAYGGEDQFYNLKDDPGETRNLITSSSQTKNNLRDSLDFHSSQLKLIEQKDAPAAVGTKTLQNLKALGYIN